MIRGGLCRATSFVALILIGCVTTPTDRSEITNPTAPISFEGYYPVKSVPVTLEARDPATGTFARFAASTTGTAPYRALGTDWYDWSTNAVVPARFWQAGRQGSLAVVPATAEGHLFRGLEENWASCFAQHSAGTTTNFEQQCATGNTITLCTSNYLPFSTRRSPCPPRALVGIRSDGEDFWPLPEVTATIVPQSTPSTIRWRGDGVSFIDVFDAPPDAGGLPSATGVNVVRIFYPNNRDSDAEVAFDPNALAASIGVTDPRLPWRGIRTIRQYDIGECSAFRSWRAVLDSLVPVLERTLDELTIGKQTVQATPLTRAALRPVLRADGNDAVAFSQGFSIQSEIGNAGRLYMRTTVRLSASGGRITAVVEGDNTTVDYQPSAGFHIAALFTDRTEAGVEESVRRQLSRLVPNAVQSALPPTIRTLDIVKRVSLRSDGIEFVLAENSQDRNYDLFARQDLCVNRAINTAPSTTGLVFTLFDPPISSDPRTFGGRL